MDKIANIMEYSIITGKFPSQIRTSGLIKNVPFHSTPGTKDGDWMLTVFLEGEGLYRNSRENIKISAGMIGIVGPADPGILFSNPENPYNHLYCRFNGEFAISLCLDILKREGVPFFKHSEYLAAAEHIKKIGYYHSNKLSNRFGQNEALLLQVLSILIEPLVRNSETPPGREDFEHYLQLHLSRNISLMETAEYFHLSRASFCRMFKKTTGDTFQHMLQTMRMDWACRLLKDTPLSISRIAERIGYLDALYFSRVFKKATGLSPRNWRLKNQNIS